MKAATESVISQVLASEYGDQDIWIVVEKGERQGWFSKYYLLLFNPKRSKLAYYKASHGEYVMAELGNQVIHPSLSD